MLIETNKYLGLTIEEATKQAKEDGIILHLQNEKEDNKEKLTTEYRPNRLVITVKNGLIIEGVLN